jgi:3',5'-cyclic-AMP phosphodiesterase
LNRREFLGAAGMALAARAIAVPPPARADARLDSFDFVFLTDTHIRPELDAPDGCHMAFKSVNSVRPDFAIQGGDHIDDALEATPERATELFDLYASAEKSLGIPVRHAIGNHDVFGVASDAMRSNPLYGKRMYQQRYGDTYYSFNHRGYHFVILDSIQIVGSTYEARVDAGQLAWLEKDLAALAPHTPVIVVTHVPLVTGAQSYLAPRPDKAGKVFVQNAWQILPLLQKQNVLAVFQGHTHINEVVTFRTIPYVSCGAVCGNWWHGARLGIPEGFTVVSLRNGLCAWRYETYGFHTIDPQVS